MSDCPYLKITIGDNDFTGVAMLLGQTLIDTFTQAGKYPTEKDLPQIKGYIAKLWWSLFNLENFYEYKTITDYSEVNIEYFEKNLELKIVSYLDIPDWDNGESFYVPLSGNFYETTIVR